MDTDVVCCNHGYGFLKYTHAHMHAYIHTYVYIYIKHREGCEGVTEGMANHIQGHLRAVFSLLLQTP